jgi:hypothetical protein
MLKNSSLLTARKKRKKWHQEQIWLQIGDKKWEPGGRGRFLVLPPTVGGSSIKNK